MYIAVDIETNSEALDGDLTNIWCIAHCDENGKQWLVTEDEWKEDKRGYAEYLQGLAEDNTLIFHNAAFDLYNLEKFFNIRIANWECTHILSYVTYPARPEGHSLGAWGAKLGYPKGKHEDFSGYSARMGEYCLQDALICLKIWEDLQNSIPPIYAVEKAFFRPLLELNSVGVQIDRSKFEYVNQEISALVDESVKEILKVVLLAPGAIIKTKNPRSKYLSKNDISSWELYGYIPAGYDPEKNEWHSQKIVQFNPGSSNHIEWALKTLYNWEPKQLSSLSGKAVTDKAVLAELPYPLAQLLLEYSEVNKLKSTYGASLLAKVTDDDRLYTNYNPCVTKTGRLSSSSPNLQNIPSRGEKGNQIRSLFTAVPGKKLVGIDIDQFQMRILAWYLSKMLPDEPTAHVLYDDFNHNSECDPHAVTARLLFGDDFTKDQRKAAKTINFGFLFGIGVNKISRQLTISIAEARQLLNLMKEKFPALPMLKELVVDECKSNRGTLHTLYGRRGIYPDIFSTDKGLQSGAQRQAFNFIIQGTEADIVKVMETKVWQLVDVYGLDAKFVLQCHDEFIYECDENQSAQLMDIMNQIINSSDWLPGLKVTGSAKMGDNWMEIH